MQRVLFLVIASALMSGCQTRNPYAAFGPPTIPAPTTTQTPPHYPPSGATAASAKAPVASSRPSVSANGSSVPSSRSTFIADAADREPIRIVEDSTAAARIAAASRAKSPDPRQASPVPQPRSQSPPPRSAPPAAGPKTGSAPSGSPRKDPAVAPANYEQASPAFTEAPPAAGQWRAR